MAMVTRRTLTRTHAPIFNNFKRIVPQVALANWVPARASRRSAETSTLSPLGNNRFSRRGVPPR